MPLIIIPFLYHRNENENNITLNNKYLGDKLEEVRVSSCTKKSKTSLPSIASTPQLSRCLQGVTQQRRWHPIRGSSAASYCFPWRLAAAVFHLTLPCILGRTLHHTDEHLMWPLLRCGVLQQENQM